MAIEMLFLTRCPYCCNGNGELLFNVAELPRYFDHPPTKSFDFSNSTDQRLFVFNGEQAERGPCPHLVQMWGDCGTVRDGVVPEHLRFDWHLDFDWSHPVYRQHETDLFCSLIFEVVLRSDVPDHFKGEIPIDECKFHRDWHAVGGNFNGSRFHVDGTALYAADIASLYDRAPRLVEAYKRSTVASP